MITDIKRKEKIKKLFTRNIVGINPERVLNINDNLILNQWFEQEKKQLTIRELTKDFNPDIHIIVTKEQLDITNQIKALAGMASTLQDVKNVQAEMATKVTEVHAVQTAYTDAKPKKALNRQEAKALKEKEDQERRRRIQLNMVEKAGLSRK